MRKPLLLFIVGSAGTGKTTIAKALCKKRIFTFLDKDIVGGKYSDWMMEQLGADIHDRDSDLYRMHCRDLEYVVTMDVALDNLALGNDVLCVGPFGNELKNPNWLAEQLDSIGLSIDQVNVGVIHIHVSDCDVIKSRIQSRNHPKDAWKLANWEAYAKRILSPDRFVCAWEEGIPVLHLDSGEAGIEPLVLRMLDYVRMVEADTLLDDALLDMHTQNEREILGLDQETSLSNSIIKRGFHV